MVASDHGLVNHTSEGVRIGPVNPKSALVRNTVVHCNEGNSPRLLKIIKQFPQDCGVYLMKDSAGNIIYIGKAKNIRKRVASYFVPPKADGGMMEPGQSWKTARLVSKITDIEFVVTDNETEAFLLESNLIKRYRPLFNIELKDQQRFTYLKLTDEAFPRLVVARRNRNGKFLGPKGHVYGPFVRGSSKFLTIGLLRKLFKIRICDRLPKRPCLEYFIKNCDAPCIDNVSAGQYGKNVSELKDILGGKKDIEKFAQALESNMQVASRQQEYEKAMEIRDTLSRLDNLRVRQKMEKAVSRLPEEEYVGILRDETKAVAHVMTLRRTRGVIADRRKFEFDLVADNSLGSFLLQYYSSMPAIPRFIFVNEEPESRTVLQESLQRIAGHSVRIVVIDNEIHSNEKHELMSMITRNLQIYMQSGYDPAVIELKNALGLANVPEVIDCFDVSNLGTRLAVGSCTRFVNGKPKKTEYRKFRVRQVQGQNDFAMIGELVTRRYSSTNPEDLPDLVVVDGGRGQLGSASSAMLAAGMKDVPCISLAKENEVIYTQSLSEPVVLPRRSASLRMIQYLRDEAHRFSLAYNVNRRRISATAR